MNTSLANHREAPLADPCQIFGADFTQLSGIDPLAGATTADISASGSYPRPFPSYETVPYTKGKYYGWFVLGRPMKLILPGVVDPRGTSGQTYIFQWIEEQTPQRIEFGREEGTTETSTSHSRPLSETDDLLVRLTVIDGAGDQRAFVTLVNSTEWTKHPSYAIDKAISVALSLDLTTLAMNLTRIGSQIFLHDLRLQRAARVLAPPVVRGTSPASGKGLDASYAWLRKHANRYHGKWVAVRAGKFLGAADSLDGLRKTIGSQPNLGAALITKVR